jgi:predicted RNA-binding Zn-ribbon protein involved in translation (DUF1610 family)
MEKELGAWQPKMHKCSTCGIEIHVSRCPDCGGNPLPSAGQPRKALNNYSLLLAPGLLVGLLAYIVFPLLDAGPLVALGLCTFFLPLVMQLSSIVRKRLSEDLGRLRTIYVYSSLALLLLALLPLLNGWLDGSPASAVKATVIQKTAVLNRSTTSYRLTVSSWRPGRSVEELRVGARTYDNVFVGNTITVAVHKGFFGLPWDGAVSSK